LFVSLFASADVELESIVITEVVGNTYFAELHLKGSGGERVISCRPSDAVAIALRAGVPMFATEAIMDEVGKETAETHVDTEEEILDEFRDFIDSIRPEDFQG
jgi:bifunctional DNase/RNase